jgi:hypothetical protein
VEQFVRQSVSFSLEELQWMKNQSRTVKKLWFECIHSEPSGEKFETLDTSLNYQSFRKAKAVLDGKWFEFSPVKEYQVKGRPKTVGWQVRRIMSSLED